MTRRIDDAMAARCRAAGRLIFSALPGSFNGVQTFVTGFSLCW
jgi:hypothetical protein